MSLIACAGCVGADAPSSGRNSASLGLVEMGASLYAEGRHDSARVVWAQALADNVVEGSAEEATLRIWLGLAAWRLGDYDTARQHGERGLELARAHGVAAEVARARNALGLLAWHEGRLSDAAELFEAALAAYTTSSDAAGIVRASNNLGLVRYDVGRFDDARFAFLIARDSARSTGNIRSEGRVLTNLGMLEIWTGEPVRALELLSAARSRARADGDVVGLANALGQTGVAFMVLGQPGQALAALDSSLAIARENGMREEEANDLVVMAGIHADAGDTDRALRLLAEARQINDELGLRIEAGSVLREEAVLRAARGAHDAARRDVLAAIALHREAGARREEFLDVLVLADVERRRGERGAADARLREAAGIATELGSAHARLALAVAEARLADGMREPRRALRVLDGAADDMRVGTPAVHAEANALRLRAWLALGQLDSAVVAGRRAVDAVESIRDGFASGMLRSTFIADRSRVYADLVMALLMQGDSAAAFEVADAARGRAIIEHLGSARSQGGPAMLRAADAERLLRRIDQLLSQLEREDAVPQHERGPGHAAVSVELIQHLEEARQQYAALRVSLAEHNVSAPAGAGLRPAGAASMRTDLAADEALVEYLLTTDRLFIFVVSRGAVEVIVREVAAGDVVHRVQLARELLTRREAAGREASVTTALHDLLLGSVAGRLRDAGVRHLFIVPHGALTYLPFAALRDGETGRLLVDYASVTILPSAAVLSHLRRHPVEPGRPDAVAFAPFPRRLPATATEARSLRKSLSGAKSVIGRRATEAAVRRALTEGRVVHIATHGVMNAHNPLFSRLELGRSGTASRLVTPSDDDGRLEVHELLDLSIASPLVFLSGCETGLGTAGMSSFNAGEDYATLAQAFLMAGAQNVVSTLWRIDDAGAAAFAARFYHHLQQQPPPAALAAAQRDLRADARWRSPYYWAGYILAGATNPQTAPLLSVQ